MKSRTLPAIPLACAHRSTWGSLVPRALRWLLSGCAATFYRSIDPLDENFRFSKEKSLLTKGPATP
jgi:hypothetical protein